MTEQPVGVIGASMAGLCAAGSLAQRGVPVTIYEAQRAFEPDARTLIVTPAWLRLQNGGGQFAVLNRIDTFELISRSASARIPLQQPDIVVERARFLRALARRAVNAGARLRLGHRLVSMERAGPAWRLRFHDGVEDAAVSRVLGADGVDSTVAQTVGRGPLQRVAILQARVALPPDLSADTVRVWFERGSTRFFTWLIPESSNTGVAGLIAETDGSARDALARFLASQDLRPLGYQAATVPLHPLGGGAAPSVGGVLLAGDAAGQVKVTTVGGVVTGMQGGLAAARVWLDGAGVAQPLRPLRRELDAHALVRHVLDAFTNEDYDALLARLNRRACRVLETYPRDELTSALWRLLLTQPRWLSLGAQALVRSMVRGRAP